MVQYAIQQFIVSCFVVFKEKGYLKHPILSWFLLLKGNNIFILF